MKMKNTTKEDIELLIEELDILTIDVACLHSTPSSLTAPLGMCGKRIDPKPNLSQLDGDES